MICEHCGSGFRQPPGGESCNDGDVCWYRHKEAKLRAALETCVEDLDGMVYNYRKHGHVDESWWESAEQSLAKAREAMGK